MMRIVVITTTKYQQIPLIECTHYRKWLELNAFQGDSYPWNHPSFLPLLTILSPTTSLTIILGQHSYSWFSTLNAHYNHEELLGNGSSVPKKLYIKMLINSSGEGSGHWLIFFESSSDYVQPGPKTMSPQHSQYSILSIPWPPKSFLFNHNSQVHVHGHLRPWG